MCTYTERDTCNLVLILPARAAPDTQNHIPNICLLSRMTPYLCGPTCGMSDAPLSSFSTEWVSDYVCACVSTTVLLVSSYRDGTMCRNGPLCCLAGRPDPSRSTSITTWNLNVKHGPPATAICLSLWVSRPGHSHTHANTLTCYYSIVLTCTNILRSKEMSPTLMSSRFRMCLKRMNNLQHL